MPPRVTRIGTQPWIRRTGIGITATRPRSPRDQHWTVHLAQGILVLLCIAAVFTAAAVA